MFTNEARAYPELHLSGVPFLGRLLALPTNVRLDWKGFPVTYILQAY